MTLPRAIGLLGLMLFAGPALAQQGEQFRGKEVSLSIGAGAGGGSDIYARVFGRHFGRHLPGAPVVVTRNVPGAGGLRLANQLYNTGQKDGTDLALFLAAAVLEPLFGNKEAKFETTKFTWIGNMSSDTTLCFAGAKSGLRSWEDMKQKEFTFGASGPSAIASIQTKVLGELLHVRPKVIHGYQGVRTSIVAMERGELDGACGIYLSTVRSQFAREIADKEIGVWITFADKRVTEFPEAPSIYELLTSDEDKQLADLIFGQSILGRPIAGPPGIPPQIASVLRRGFKETMDDPSFRKEASAAKLEIDPMSGEETQKQFNKFYELPPAVAGRAREIMARPM